MKAVQILKSEKRLFNGSIWVFHDREGIAKCLAGRNDLSGTEAYPSLVEALESRLLEVDTEGGIVPGCFNFDVLNQDILDDAVLSPKSYPNLIIQLEGTVKC